jgi:hypothetical protein
MNLEFASKQAASSVNSGLEASWEWIGLILLVQPCQHHPWHQYVLYFFTRLAHLETPELAGASVSFSESPYNCHLPDLPCSFGVAFLNQMTKKMELSFFIKKSSFCILFSFFTLLLVSATATSSSSPKKQSCKL